MPDRPRIFRDREFWLVVGYTLAYFGLPVLLGGTYFFRDLYLWSFPQTARLAEIVHSGQSLLWDPLIYAGQPLLGIVQYFTFYPTTWLALVMPPVTAVNVEIVIHFALCAAATYALARSLGVTPTASAIAGAVFVFSGVTLSFGNLLGRVLAMPHTVLLLLFWHRYLGERRRIWLALAAAAGALVLFAGSAEQLMFCVALAAAWGAAYPYGGGTGSRGRRFLLAAPLAIAIIGLSAVQILPMIQLVRNSRRGTEFSTFERGMWSVNPRRLPELLVPGFFGDVDTLREADYWGASAQDGTFPIVLSFYLGATVLILAGIGAVSKTPGPLPRACRVLLGSALLGSLVLSLGRFLPSLGPLGPTRMLGFFRFPEKFLFIVPLPAALLAGHAVDALWRPEAPSGARRTAATMLGASAVLLLLAAAAIHGSDPFAAAWQRLFFLRESDEHVRRALALRLLQAAAFPAAAALVALPSRPGTLRRMPAVLGGLIVLDLSVAGLRLNPTAPREMLTREPALAKTVRGLVGDHRFYREVNKSDLLRAPSNEVRWRCEWNRDMLVDYVGAGFGIPLIFHRSFDGLDSARHARVAMAVQRLPWTGRLPILSAASVRAFMTSDDVSARGAEVVAQVPNASDRVFRLYRNSGAADQAELVHYWHSVASPDEAIGAMLSPGFDPRRHAVLEAKVPAPPKGPCVQTEVDRTESRANAQAWKTRSSCDGFLVVSEQNDPGWRIRVDGTTSSVVSANAMFSAVFLPAGVHEVRRVYRPIALRVGAIVSLLTVGVLIGSALRSEGSKA